MGTWPTAAPSPVSSPTDTHVLLYDGVCGFCHRTVKTILAHDNRGTLRFAAIQSNYSKAVMARHAMLQNIDSLVLIETSSTGEERVFTRSTAVLHVAIYLGGLWKLLWVAYMIPAPIRDFFYDLFASYRYKIFGKHETCMVPPAAVRGRFIDLT